MKYPIGSRFINPSNNIIYTAASFNEGCYTLEPECILDYDINESSELVIAEEELPLPMYDDYYIGEMATIVSDPKLKYRIAINPDVGRIGAPYFKVYSTHNLIPGESEIARLHFFDTGMEYHQDKFKDWHLSKTEIKTIKELLKMPYKKTNYSIWDMTKFKWNEEYSMFYNGKTVYDEEDYFNGVYDKDPDINTHPSYVPSTASIPDTWVYNPPKGKNKR